MNLRRIGPYPDGSREVEILCNEVEFSVLIRCLRRLPGAKVSNTHHDFLNDDAGATINYKGFTFDLYTPFSDYFISCTPECPDEVWEKFVAYISDYNLTHLIHPYGVKRGDAPWPGPCYERSYHASTTAGPEVRLG